MAKKRAKREKQTLTGKPRKETLTEQQRLRRADLKVQRIEAQLYGKIPRDSVISEHLEGLPRGERGAFIKDAIEEKIARMVAARNEKIAAENALDDLRTQVREQQQQIARLHEENSDLRLNGSVPFEDEPITALSNDDAQQAKLSGKLKRISFVGLQ